MTLERKIIGIVGGVGPYAGLDLNRKVFDSTVTDGSDQDHLEVILFSAGSRIPDRTGYLLGQEKVNPAEGLFQACRALAEAGAGVAAVACNTAHAAAIMEPLREKLKKEGLSLELVDMIEATGEYVRGRFGPGARVGLLATEGTIRCRVYERLLDGPGAVRSLVIPDDEMILRVHRAIYDREWGIKARSNPVSEKAAGECRAAAEHLADRGAAAVILGCTELPLALPGRFLGSMELIDPTLITARALVKKAAPEKLRPLE